MLNLGLPTAIFDMDGTLIDSMPTWRSLNASFLTRHNLSAPPSFVEELRQRSMHDSAQLLIEKFSLSLSVDEIIAENNRYMDQQYEVLREKPGASAYLKALKAAGVRMVVATYTPLPMALHALRAHGMLDCFEWVTTPDIEGISKNDPAFFLALAQKLGQDPAQIVVYEDMPAVMCAAKACGKRIHVAAVYIFGHGVPPFYPSRDQTGISRTTAHSTSASTLAMLIRSQVCKISVRRTTRSGSPNDAFLTVFPK